MKNPEKLEQLLKQALSSTQEPDRELNIRIINQVKERNIMKTVHRRKLSVVMLAAVLTLAMTITAFAAWQLLSPKQVAEHLQNKALAQAFEDKSAVQINQAVVSGGYQITLHGIVSGAGLSDFGGSAQEIHPDRTYAVVSIARQDGSKMPDTRDEEYGKVPFFVSPLVKGQKPWNVNIASMNGGYSELVADGVMYRLIECDGLEMFADRGLYLCVSDTNFYSIEAFDYDEATGQVTPNKAYKGVNALFDLPLNTKNADYERAEEYLKELLKGPEGEEKASPQGQIDWEKEVTKGVVLPDSVKQVTYDSEGLACYDYDGSMVAISVKSFFKEDEIGVYKLLGVNGSDKEWRAIQLMKSPEGVVTGRTLLINLEP